jgi:3'-5' exoribonuclease
MRDTQDWQLPMSRKKTFLGDLRPGDNVTDLFAVAAAQRREARNGPYWQLTLMDKSGQMEARIWSPASQSIAEIHRGAIALVEGMVQAYNGQTQINVFALQPVDSSQIDLAHFVATSSTPATELLHRIEALLHAGLTFEPWKRLCQIALENTQVREFLLQAPGARSIHHAYAGGLLEHTLAVMELTQAIAAFYPEADRQILLVAALFHDMGKAWEIGSGIDREYTNEGKLVGHLFLGLNLVENFLRHVPQLPEPLALHLRHIILSHHGLPEFGTPKEPMTVEAFILHFADNLDAKIATVRAALNGREPGTWSDRIPALGRAVFQPLRTPTAPNFPEEPCS